jgi:hypothetical protein
MLCCALYKNAGPKPFCWAKRACIDFSSSNFNLQIQTLSTCGVALSVLWKIQNLLEIIQAHDQYLHLPAGKKRVGEPKHAAI